VWSSRGYGFTKFDVNGCTIIDSPSGRSRDRDACYKVRLRSLFCNDMALKRDVQCGDYGHWATGVYSSQSYGLSEFDVYTVIDCDDGRSRDRDISYKASQQPSSVITPNRYMQYGKYGREATGVCPSRRYGFTQFDVNGYTVIDSPSGRSRDEDTCYKVRLNSPLLQ
jgi:hypothetical protein